MASGLVWLKFWLLGLKVEYIAEDAGLVLKSERVWLKFWLLGLKVEYVAEDADLAFEK